MSIHGYVVHPVNFTLPSTNITPCTRHAKRSLNVLAFFFLGGGAACVMQTFDMADYTDNLIIVHKGGQQQIICNTLLTTII